MCLKLLRRLLRFEHLGRRCHSSSAFSRSQFAQFLLLIPDRLDDDEIRFLCGALAVVRQKSHWIITTNGKMNVWKCKMIFPTDTLQKKLEITDLNPVIYY